MLPETIEDAEVLYRSVPNIEGYWNPETGAVSSAVYSDSNGVSVDRDGGRDETTIIAVFEERFSVARGIVALEAGQCRSQGAHPVARPVAENPYHAEIHQSVDRVELTRGCRKKLRDACQLVRPPAVGRGDRGL